MKNFKLDILKVRAFVFDIDGVISGNELILREEGYEPLRTLNTKDGYALHYAIKQGFLMAIITGCKSDSIEKHFKKLGASVYMQSDIKKVFLEDFMKKNNLSAEDVLYMGDDIPDYEAMQMVGVPTCPKDASVEIKKISSYISPFNGGKGCVRDIIEQVMRAQNKWMCEDAFSW